jgi:ADP-ribose pyrophosphatase YjhB (NUDIX family)
MGMDPYGGGGDPTPATFWRPRESERGAYTEKKWGQDTLAVWELSDLPPGAVVTHVTMIAYRGDKGVVAWKNGLQTLPEGAAQPGESADAAARRIMLEQVGVAECELKHLGHFRCRATSYHPTLPNNAITYQVLYGVEAGALADFPTDGEHERRIILQRDLNTILRSGYVERRREYTDTLDHWLLERLKANLKA